MIYSKDTEEPRMPAPGYPKLVRGKESGAILLATKNSLGVVDMVCLSAPEGPTTYAVGETYDVLDIRQYIDYEGVLSLANYPVTVND